MRTPNLAIIIPTYNESKNLNITIPLIKKYAKNASVIIVDDNSKDNTDRTIQNLKNKYSKITLLKREKKMGRGTAVIYGFNYAFRKGNFDYFLEMDADMSHDPKELPEILRAAEPKAIVIGSRYIKGSKTINIPLRRKLLSNCANLFINILFNLPAHDNTNGYRLYPKKGIKIILKHSYISKGFVCIAESAYVLHKKGFKLKEVPSIFVNRKLGGSKVTPHEILTWIRDLLKIRFTS